MKSRCVLILDADSPLFAAPNGSHKSTFSASETRQGYTAEILFHMDPSTFQSVPRFCPWRISSRYLECSPFPPLSRRSGHVSAAKLHILQHSNHEHSLALLPDSISYIP